MHKVLIVDDDAHVRNLFFNQFSQFKAIYEIIEAADGEGARRAIREKSPEVIFLDVSMPGHIDGFQILKEIRSDSKLKDSLVAMVTAKRNEEETKKARDLGANAYFMKPFSPLIVHEWVRSELKSMKSIGKNYSMNPTPTFDLD